MRTITIGDAEQRVVLNILRQAEAGRPLPDLKARDAAAVRSFMRRLGWFERVDADHPDR